MHLTEPRCLTHTVLLTAKIFSFKSILVEISTNWSNWPSFISLPRCFLHVKEARFRKQNDDQETQKLPKKVLLPVRELRAKQNVKEVCCYRQISLKHGVNIAYISRPMKHGATNSALLEVSDGRGRRKRRTQQEGKLNYEPASEFHNKGTRLNTEWLCRLAAVLMSTFERERLSKIWFDQNKPGRIWISNVLHLRKELTLKRIMTLDAAHNYSIYLENIVRHIAKHDALKTNLYIHD